MLEIFSFEAYNYHLYDGYMSFIFRFIFYFGLDFGL